MSLNSHVEQPTNKEAMRPAESHIASQMFGAEGMKEYAASIRGLNQPGHQPIDAGEVLGNNFAINGFDDKAKSTQAGMASTDKAADTKSAASRTGEINPLLGSAQSKNEVNGKNTGLTAEGIRHGDFDNSSYEDHLGQTVLAGLSDSTKNKGEQPLRSPESTLVTARTSAALSQTERTRSAAQVEKNRSVEKAKTKQEQNKDRGRSLDRTGTKSDQSTAKRDLSASAASKLDDTKHQPASREHIAGNTFKQPEQHAKQQGHRTEAKDHTADRKAHTPGQHGHDKAAVKHTQPLAQHDHEAAKHQEQPAQKTHETAAKHEEQPKQHKPEETTKHQEQPAQQIHEAVTKHQEPPAQHIRETIAHRPETTTDHSNNKRNIEQAKEIVTSQRLERPTPAQASDKIAPSQRTEKQTTPARQIDKSATRTPESLTAQQRSNLPPISSPESAKTKHVSTEEALKHAPPLTAKQEPAEKLVRQTQLLAASNEKGTHKSAETHLTNSKQPAGKELPKEGTRITKLEADQEKGTADRPNTTPAQSVRDNYIADWADVNHNNAEYLARQDHAATATPAHTGQSVRSSSTSDLSLNALARSTAKTSNHLEDSNKVHTINHIVSSLNGQSGKIEPGQIKPEPEVVNNNKNTGAGTTTSTTTAASRSAPSAGHSSVGHSGHHAGVGHGPGGHMNPGQHQKGQPSGSQTGTNNSPSSSSQTGNKNGGDNSQSGSSNQNPGSKQTGTTDPGNGKANQPVSTGQPGNNPTTGNSYGYSGPIIVEQPFGNAGRQAAFLLELFAEIALMSGMDSHNNGRRLAINSHAPDITNPAIPGNIFNAQPSSNQSGNPSDWQSSQPVVYQPSASDPRSPITSPAGPTENTQPENNIGLNLNPVVSEPAPPVGTGDGLQAGKLPAADGGNGAATQAPTAPNGGGFDAKSPTANPTLSEPGTGQLGTNPFPNGGPYLNGSVDYWGGDPGSNAVSPGAAPNAATPSPDGGLNNGSSLSGQPNHWDQLQPENAQPRYLPLTGEINNKNDGHNHGLDKTAHRAEISDPWQISHHLHEHGLKAHENQLEHKYGQNRHDLLANDLWPEQNHGRKHAHTHKVEPNHTNDPLPPVKDDMLIGQLIALLEDTKANQDPNQQARTYVVKHGDTLESIAADVLFDFRLGLLIYIINKVILPVSADWRQCKLREGLVLFLPIEEEIRSFRLAMSLPANDQLSEENLGHETVKQLAARRQNVERLLGPIRALLGSRPESYSKREEVTVRLGDTLRSIALKHPSLHDVSLWKLLAQLNELSLAVDSKGVPISILTRGMILQLPTADEIAAYRSQQAANRRALSPRKALQTEVLTS